MGKCSCSSHTHAGRDASFWIHLLLNILAFVVPVGGLVLIGAVAPLTGDNLELMTLGAVGAVASIGIMTVTQPVWIAPDVTADRRFAIALGEWFWSILLMVGFSFASVFVFGFFMLR